MSTLQEAASINAALTKREAVGQDLITITDTRWEAQQTLTTALRNFYAALQGEITATAKDAAARGVPYQSFLKACIANSRNNGASWSGGVQSTPNVIEALTRHAWLEAGNDIHISFFFNKGQ